MTVVRDLLERRAALQRALADVDDALASALGGTPEIAEPADEVLNQVEAAELVGEPVSTFRRRPLYRKALVSAPGERRPRYSRKALLKLLDSRLAQNATANL
jgi:hypothetical protein